MSCMVKLVCKIRARVSVKYTVCSKSCVITATFWPPYIVTLFTSHLNVGLIFVFELIIVLPNIISIFINNNIYVVIIIWCDSFLD